MAEVLLSIVVFTISIVGIVALQRVSLSADHNSSILREGQRLGANEMEHLLARSFNDLLELDLLGQDNPTFPYDDLALTRMFPYRGVPMDVDWSTIGTGDSLPPGLRQNQFRVVRRVSALDIGPPNSNTLSVPIQGLQLEVWVLWLDHHPSAPAPTALTSQQLSPSMLDPTSNDFRPYVQGIHLTSIRANDGKASSVPLPTPDP